MRRSVSRAPGSPRERSAARLLVVFGPVLAASALVILLALVAGLHGFYPQDMCAVAVVLGVMTMLLAIVRFFRQTEGRRS